MNRPRICGDYICRCSAHCCDCVEQVPKTVLTKDSSEPTTMVIQKTSSIYDVTERLCNPDSSHYQLRDMLKTGNIPEFVDVSGVLDSSDPTDLSNVGIADSLYDALQGRIKNVAAPAAPAAEPAAPAAEPAANVQS